MATTSIACPSRVNPLRRACSAANAGDRGHRQLVALAGVAAVEGHLDLGRPSAAGPGRQLGGRPLRRRDGRRDRPTNAPGPPGGAPRACPPPTARRPGAARPPRACRAPRPGRRRAADRRLRTPPGPGRRGPRPAGPTRLGPPAPWRASTTAMTPAAVTPAGCQGPAGRGGVETAQAGQSLRRDAPGDQVGVGDRRLPSRPGRSRPARDRRRRSAARRPGPRPGRCGRWSHPRPRWCARPATASGSADPATRRWAAGSGRPPRIRQTSVLVPPMSRVTQSANPAADPAADAASTPPAGPESRRATGRAGDLVQTAPGRRRRSSPGPRGPRIGGRPGRHAHGRRR